ncbi:enoyl-CoA hydratase/isomerase family protein [[Mycobacterium] vasticus]|uniref:Enoyl-CoA hydratase/isomerase family protein n=1 Tax=[Mycobacterium] vasticus TaxID=2875777 RepID=A0ABU5YZZ0_9MYCO|nr:enoyl-CoA hydratase/isomerase family protein [Mycolicibacter sp. MYC017]MEB3070722.1 enoyl-CoA hydratase/isomerase family protein [Mycolicibacter sp. MYC017]
MGSQDNAVLVTLDFPEKRNALNADDAVDLVDVLRRASAQAVETQAAAVVLTGNGAFCSGGDLPYFAEVGATCSADEVRGTVYTKMQDVMRALRDCAVPTIAAIDGPAIGLGMDLALGCDMRFIGPQGYLMQGWARAGLIAGTGGVGFLARLAPQAFWSLTTEQHKVGMEAAVDSGLGEQGEPDAMTAALRRAGHIAEVMGSAVAGHYAALYRQARWPDESEFEASARIQGGLITSERFRKMAERVLGTARRDR